MGAAPDDSLTAGERMAVSEVPAVAAKTRLPVT
jgi:hypothetical protein